MVNVSSNHTRLDLRLGALDVCERNRTWRNSVARHRYEDLIPTAVLVVLLPHRNMGGWRMDELVKPWR